MKKIIFFFVAISFFSTTVLKASISTVSFVVTNELTDGTFYINPSTGGQVGYSYRLARGFVPNTTNLEDGSCIVTLVMKVSGAYQNISSPLSIADADWHGEDYYLPAFSLFATIPAQATYGPVYLKVQQGTTITYSSMSYGVVTVPSAGFPSGLNSMVLHSYAYPNVPSTKFYPSSTTPALSVGQSIYSPNNLYRLTLQTDGNLVLYKVGDGNALWNSQTQANSIKSKTLYFQPDGNLVLYQGLSDGGPSNWASGRYDSSGQTSLQNNAFYALQDDGNLVFYFTLVQAATGINWCYVLGETGTNTGVSTHNGKLSP
ncbi:hypothetical protein [Pedobacter sp. L105]|uniref:hypothetical protein n=1 Tax=Pedobacter sp. L105 TaxID=1641871 RepID=UPI00131D3892|nr:hypothetical protein [Pedobacter sp. L105]